MALREGFVVSLWLSPPRATRDPGRGRRGRTAHHVEDFVVVVSHSRESACVRGLSRKIAFYLGIGLKRCQYFYWNTNHAVRVAIITRHGAEETT